MDNRNFFSETFIKDLLIIDSILKTDHETPKTARQIQGEVEKKWNRFFPNDPLKKNTSLQTIHRHVQNMNLLKGLYDIKLHEDNRLGYYNTKHLLTPSEVAVIGAAIYNITSLTDDEKKIIFNKMKSATTGDGGSIAYGFERQLNLENSPRREFSKGILSKVERICKAIVEGKKITFNFKPNDNLSDERKITASPYCIVERDNEIFLTAKVDSSPKPIDFRLTFISKIEIQTEDFKSDRKFSIARHLSGITKDAPQIELRISFPESLIENVLKHFEKNKKSQCRLIRRDVSDDSPRRFGITILVGEDEQLYEWLRQHCDKVKINFPDNVRKKLKDQLSKALSTL